MHTGWDPTDLGGDVVSTFMGRDALTLAASWFGLRSDDAVLLPAYVCEEVIKPFSRTARIVLYDVRPDLGVDANLLDDVLQSNPRIKVALFVNYFGFLQANRDDIKAVCARRNVALIEDCAHSLLTAGSGDTGDLAVYSFRKILPVTDGGGLRINKPSAEFVLPSFYSSIRSNTLSACIAIKAALKLRADVLSRAGLTSRSARVSGARRRRHAGNGHTAVRLLPMSTISRNALKGISAGDVVRRRRADYQFWEDLGARTGSFVGVTPSLTPGVCPLGFVARTPDRETLRSRSLAAGLYLRVHWRLPDAVGREHANAHDLANQTVTLPVYPELSDRDRDLLVRLLCAPRRPV
jgi:hypothetical protein